MALAESAEYTSLEESIGYQNLGDILLGTVQKPLTCEYHHFAIGGGEGTTAERDRGSAVMIVAVSERGVEFVPGALGLLWLLTCIVSWFGTERYNRV